MGRSANTFAFVLVFVLLALVVYFIYQAATGTSGATPDDQAMLPPPSAEGKADPDRFATDKTITPAPEEKGKEPAPLPVPAPEPPPAPPEESSEGAGKTPEPPPPQFFEDPPPEPAPPAVPAPSVSKEADLLPVENEYTTQTGDTPWFLAVMLLGDGRRWPDIVAANPALVQEGRSPDKETALPAGLRIKAPKDDAPKEETPVPPGEAVQYEVQAGDTLSGIMQRFYGEASITIQREILAANPDLDPDLLLVKSKITLPEIPGKGPKTGA